MFGMGAATQCTGGSCGIGTVFRIPQVYRRRSMLPSHLHDVMGSANLSLARGDYEAAVKLCNEVIRQGKGENPLSGVVNVLVMENRLVPKPLTLWSHS